MFNGCEKVTGSALTFCPHYLKFPKSQTLPIDFASATTHFGAELSQLLLTLSCKLIIAQNDCVAKKQNKALSD